MNFPKFVDVCSGVGGLSVGLINAGMVPLAAYDVWKPALKVYRTNIGPHAFQADLGQTRRLIKRISLLEPDIIAGGPPCQEFSSCGKRVEGTRAALTVDFATVVVAVRPRWVIMENVPRALVPILPQSAQAFGKGGVCLTEIVLNASQCGVPQKRKRFFCIGRMGARDGFLTHDLESGLNPEPLTVHKWLGTKPDHFYMHGRSYARRAVHSTDKPAPTVRGTHRQPPPKYPRHPNDSAGSEGLRALTVSERSLIQTFPPTWVWSGKPAQVDQMIGNAVPPMLAKFVGLAVMAYERRHFLKTVTNSIADLAA
jgi:DNA (cytosine-5)-methyltransferase 1